jgi:hypothetical protein
MTPNIWIAWFALSTRDDVFNPSPPYQKKQNYPEA